MPEHITENMNQDIAAFLADASDRYACTFTVVLINGKTIGKNTWAIVPTEKYIEFSNTGPLAFREIQWVVIHPVTEKKIGLRVPPKITDNTYAILGDLRENHLPYSLTEHNIKVAFLCDSQG